MNRWVATSAAMLFFSATLAVQAGRVAIIQATTSAPNEAERSYSQAMARNLDRWLGELDVPRTLITDDQVSADTLAASRVAILAYNPSLPGAELAQLRRWVGQGGRLIVFYSGDPALAALLGVRLGRYLVGGDAGRFQTMRFNASAPPGIPPTVSQNSRNIRAAHPASDQARVIATWEDAAGRPTGEPAWVQSRTGFWMSHVLLDDGDTWNKKRMLLALVASADPALWAPAARRCLASAGTLGRYASVSDAAAQIPSLAATSVGRRRTEAVLSSAVMLHNQLAAALENRRFAEVVEKSDGVRRLFLEAYATAQSPRAGEVRGAWSRFGTGLYPGDWGKTCRLLAENGFTDVFPFVLAPTVAHCRSEVVAPSPTMASLGDQLEACVKAAHMNLLKVHAWKICWKLDGVSADEVARFRRQGRLQVTDRGETIPWLCPTSSENLQLEKDAVRDLVKRYAVDGVHLDYIRYNDAHVCFCSRCREAYERAIGRPATPWPPPANNWALRKEYFAWRHANITRLVRDVSALAKSARPGIRISAAVYGKYPSCLEAVGQDWPAWLRSGAMDFVCPMNYTADPARFGEYLRGQAAFPDLKGRIWPGIGITATESRLDAVQVMDQVRAAREGGAPGFVVFELNRVFEREILPYLHLGMTARP